MMAFSPSSRWPGTATRWTDLHNQLCSLLEVANTDDDYFVAVRRRFGSSDPPGMWEPIPTGGNARLVDIVTRLQLPAAVSALGVVTWATARRVTPGGFDETAAWIAIVTTSSGVALSATITVDTEVMWTPHPTGQLAEACRAAFGCATVNQRRRPDGAGL